MIKGTDIAPGFEETNSVALDLRKKYRQGWPGAEGSNLLVIYSISTINLLVYKH